MAENTFEISIITPDRTFYQGQASMLEFTTTEGDIGVYPQHIPLTTVVAPGICTIHEAEGEKKCALHAGLAEILPDKVTILAEIVEWPEEIDPDRAHKAEERARARLNNKTENTDVFRAEIALKKAIVRQNLLH